MHPARKHQTTDMAAIDSSLLRRQGVAGGDATWTTNRRSGGPAETPKCLPEKLCGYEQRNKLRQAT